VVWVALMSAGMESVTLPGFPPGVTREDLFGAFGTRAAGTFRLCRRSAETFLCDDLARTPVEFAS